MLETEQRALADLGEGGGPTLLVVGGLHGNEPAGVEAAVRVAASLRARRDRLRGRVVLLTGNRQALAVGRRYLGRDLNRAWTEDIVAGLRDGVPGGEVPEDREQRELLTRITTLLESAKGPIYLLDLHTTSGGGGAFSTAADTLENRSLALTLPVPLVLGLEELVEGTLHDFVGRRGCISLAFEAGQHEEPLAVDRAEAAIWIMLTATGILPEAAVPELPPARKLLAREGREGPRVLEMRYRHPLSPGDGFRMQPDYHNFQRVQLGEVLAHDRDGPIRAPESGRILMPLYQVQGDDGFFVVREFRPFWLNVSQAMRRLGLARVVHWLPGIRRHPSRPGALVVDRRVARWYALQILHLLGYRRHEDDGDWLVVLRQRVSEPRGDGSR